VDAVKSLGAKKARKVEVGKMKCPYCEEFLQELKWFAEAETDDGYNIYVTYVGRCPHCYGEVEKRSGYETIPDEPLRHED